MLAASKAPHAISRQLSGACAHMCTAERWPRPLLVCTRAACRTVKAVPRDYVHAVHHATWHARGHGAAMSSLRWQRCTRSECEYSVADRMGQLRRAKCMHYRPHPVAVCSTVWRFKPLMMLKKRVSQFLIDMLTLTAFVSSAACFRRREIACRTGEIGLGQTRIRTSLCSARAAHTANDQSW